MNTIKKLIQFQREAPVEIPLKNTSSSTDKDFGKDWANLPYPIIQKIAESYCRTNDDFRNKFIFIRNISQVCES